MEKKRLWGYLLGAAVLVLIIKYSDHILNGGRLLLSILMPLFLGCAIAYVLNILVARLERLPFSKRPARGATGAAAPLASSARWSSFWR